MTKEYKDWLFVRVEPEAMEPQLANGNGLFVFYDRKPISMAARFQLPPGSWQIIGKGDQVLEVEWQGIVKQVHSFGRWENYCEINTIADYHWFKTATQSGHSLLRSLKMEPGTTLILKKLKP